MIEKRICIIYMRMDIFRRTRKKKLSLDLFATAELRRRKISQGL